MRPWSVLPWVFGVIVLIGGFLSQPNAMIFYRSLLLAAVIAATIGSAAAMRCFESSDLLFKTWAALAAGYVLLSIRYALRLLVTLHVMRMPVMFDRVLLIVHNMAVPLALLLFVVSWRRTGLASSMSRAAAVGSTAAGIAVALLIGAFPLLHDLGNADPTLLISTLGDIVSIALIVPLLMPALELRGGLLMHTWLYLALAQVVWLMYDVWAVGRTTIGATPAWGLAIDQALRAIALLYIYAASEAQRSAIAQTRTAREPVGEPALA